MPTSTGKQGIFVRFRKMQRKVSLCIGNRLINRRRGKIVTFNFSLATLMGPNGRGIVTTHVSGG